MSIFERTITVFAIFQYTKSKCAEFYKCFRPTSSPFVSGDTFRSLCHVKIEVVAAKERIDELVHKLNFIKHKSILRLFVDLNVVGDEKLEQTFVNSLARLPLEVRRKTIVIFHNSDKVPSQSFFMRLTELEFRLYSVNIVEQSPFVQPLPIGLENRWRLDNGRIASFKRFQSKTSNQIKRKNLVFAAFTVGNNLPERSVAREACLKAGFPMIGGRIPTSRHREHLSNSYFVISPPGNGLDCHRTWEAIYLGCVPVVKRSSLSEEFTMNLPILAVEDWSDFFNLSNDQKLAVYKQLRNRSTELAFVDEWRRRLGVLTTVG